MLPAIKTHFAIKHILWNYLLLAWYTKLYFLPNAEEWVLVSLTTSEKVHRYLTL